MFKMHRNKAEKSASQHNLQRARELDRIKRETKSLTAKLLSFFEVEVRGVDNDDFWFSLDSFSRPKSAVGTFQMGRLPSEWMRSCPQGRAGFAVESQQITTSLLAHDFVMIRLLGRLIDRNLITPSTWQTLLIRDCLRVYSAKTHKKSTFARFSVL